MKARSLDLIRGSIDQVDKTVQISWIQPRVLEGAQLDTLASQFDEWRKNVAKLATNVMEKQGATRYAVSMQGVQ